MSYLESKCFIYRDLVVRNIFVFSKYKVSDIIFIYDEIKWYIYD